MCVNISDIWVFELNQDSTQSNRIESSITEWISERCAIIIDDHWIIEKWIESWLAYEEWFTVDIKNTGIRDDWFFIEKLSNWSYVLKVFIANPSYVIKNHTSYHDFLIQNNIAWDKVINYELSKVLFSLDPWQMRNSIWITITIDKDFKIVWNSDIKPCIFKNIWASEIFLPDQFSGELIRQLELLKEIHNWLKMKMGLSYYEKEREEEIHIQTIMVLANIEFAKFQAKNYPWFWFFINKLGEWKAMSYVSNIPIYNQSIRQEMYSYGTSPLNKLSAFALIWQLYWYINWWYYYNDREVLEMIELMNKTRKSKT